MEQVRRLAAILSQNYERKSEGGDLARVLAKLKGRDWPGLRDAWDTELRVEPAPWDPSHTYYTVRSAGPDQQFNTGDDLTLNILVRAGQLAPRSNIEGIRLKIEHDRGPFNGLAEIVGTVSDPTGAMIPNASVELVDAHSKKARHARADAGGRFKLSGLPASEYTVQVSQSGLQSSLRAFALQPRDRAVLSVVLQVGSVTQSVQVTTAVRMLEIGGAVVTGRNVIDVPAPAPPLNGRGGGFGVGEAGGFGSGTYSVGGEAHPARVRSYFPEALYINPEIITDKDGRASIVIPIADSITTWRMAMIASTEHGALGPLLRA